ncbi:hypothetical protein [Myxococcus phage Mx4 ts27htf-1hrm-1]|nr:hypothetical protein Mx4_p35 [Myxococcus phage Mx4]WNM70375.1 hypothetical protein [Myxococcus phage Mx4 ts27htf-1hrm-1]
MSEDLEELKRLAQAVPRKDGVDVSARGNDTQHVHAVGAFIRAATPNVVLALIARVEDVENRANVAFGWNTQNCPTATQCVLESIVLRQPMPDAAKLEALARGDRARSSEEGQRIALNQRIQEARAPLLERLEKAESRKEHTEYWYAVRLERLKDLAKERGFWPEMAAIIANGTAGSEPPTYAQQLNLAIGRAENAEKKSEALEKSLRVLAKRDGFDGGPCWCDGRLRPKHESDPHTSWCTELRAPLEVK